MADEELEAEGQDEEQGEEVSSEPSAAGGRFKLSANVIKILKMVLNYLIVVIIALTTALFVTNKNNSGGNSTKENMYQTDPSFGDSHVVVPEGLDHSLDPMIINTSDEESQYFVKAEIVISYDGENPKLLNTLITRKSQIHDAVRTVIGAKKFYDINTTMKQENLKKEIKSKVQMIVRMPGIYNIYFKDFSVN